ncbi:NADH:flavin oxidoreductase [Bacillus sp. JCM 19034]|uniref:NADH:flavin oxidoreductase n=1 Tax=Bacillus sp. JCM 19034 TaxID=1481928 RepID=UPI0007854EA5|nr:NADH:flavin oxidoreductase [Bacillus sp. JCM 19034]
MKNDKVLSHNHSIEALFQPFSIGNLFLPNRTVMAPMTRGFSPGGVPNDNVAAYYRRRAENGVGLIITEGTGINHPSSVDDPEVPILYGKKALAGWGKVVNEVHKAGGKIIPQLWHVGMIREVGAQPNKDSLPVGPSGLSVTGEKVTEPLTEEEIHLLIQAYADAAYNAKRIGFDGIEIHGAHEYLIDQFFWKRTNKRTDRYGGTLKERTRFAAEVVKECRKVVGEDFPIFFRFSQWKMSDYQAKLAENPNELAEFLEPLQEAGVDVFHCSTRRFWEAEFAGSDLNLAGWTKYLTGKPSITVGSVGLDSVFTSFDSSNPTSIQRLLDRLEKDEFDLVAIGRPLISDPAWVAKIYKGDYEEIIPFSKESLSTLY